jgi:hypothetical protein
MEYQEGLEQGSPTSSSGFSYTIHEKVKRADKRLVEYGGCARFGMDDGYMMGPMEVVFQVLKEFVIGIKEEHGCELNTRKCKMYNIKEGRCMAARREGHIPLSMQHVEEGIYVNELGERLKGITIFNVPVGEERYVEAVLRHKAREVEQTTRQYVEDLEAKYPQELWTMLQFSLQHRITYWLRTCTPEETEEMAEHVDKCIMEAVEAATGVEFDMVRTATERLRLPARMKGGGVKSATDTRRPAILGALLDILPRYIDRKAENGEEMPGHYSEQLTREIGRGAYDQEGHKNEQFLRARNIGPFLESIGRAWTHIRTEAMQNHGLREGSEQEEWQRLGPLAQPTPANKRTGEQHTEGDEEETNEGGRTKTEETQGSMRSTKATWNRGERERMKLWGCKKSERQWQRQYGR